MEETKGRIVKDRYRTIYPVDSIDETRLGFIDGWRQGILW